MKVSSTKPNGYWQIEGNGKTFFDGLMVKLGYKCMDDWYNVTVEDIYSNRGKLLRRNYNESPTKALLGVYPEHNWELGKFTHKPSQLDVKHDAKRRIFLSSAKLQHKSPASNFCSLKNTDR